MLTSREHPDQYCNNIACNCSSAMPRVNCDADSNSSSGQIVALDKICDGHTDCSNCWDEQNCDLKFPVSSPLDLCMGDSAILKTRRGIVQGSPSDLLYSTSKCFNQPFVSLTFSLTHKIGSAARKWAVDLMSQGLTFSLTLEYGARSNRLLFDIKGVNTTFKESKIKTLQTCLGTQQIVESVKGTNNTLLLAAFVSVGAFLLIGLALWHVRRKRRLLNVLDLRTVLEGDETSPSKNNCLRDLSHITPTCSIFQTA